MTKKQAIAILQHMQEPEMWDPQITEAAFDALEMAIKRMKEPEIIRCQNCEKYDTHDHRCKYWNHGVETTYWCSKAENKYEQGGFTTLGWEKYLKSQYEKAYTMVHNYKTFQIINVHSDSPDVKASLIVYQDDMKEIVDLLLERANMRIEELENEDD